MGFAFHNRQGSKSIQLIPHKKLPAQGREISDVVQALIYSFDMPACFILSGIMKKKKSQTRTRTWLYLWLLGVSAFQAGHTTKELLQKGLTTGTSQQHQNLPRGGIALQYLRPVGRDPSERAIPAEAATCRTGAGSVGRKMQRTVTFCYKQMPPSQTFPTAQAGTETTAKLTS